MSKVCRFNILSGGVLEIAPDLVFGIKDFPYYADVSIVSFGAKLIVIAHSQEEAQAILDAARKMEGEPL